MSKLRRTEFNFKVTEDERDHQETLQLETLFDEDFLICTTCGTDLKEYCKENFEVPIHPLLGVPFCTMCCGFYSSGEFSCDEDGEEKYCRWCGQGGTIFVCSSCTCGFCPSCIQKNCGKEALEFVENCEEWECLLCDVSPLWKARHFAIMANKELSALDGNNKDYDAKSEKETKFSVLFRQKYKQIFQSDGHIDGLSTSIAISGITGNETASKKHGVARKSTTNVARKSTSGVSKHTRRTDISRRTSDNSDVPVQMADDTNLGVAENQYASDIMVARKSVSKGTVKFTASRSSAKKIVKKDGGRDSNPNRSEKRLEGKLMATDKERGAARTNSASRMVARKSVSKGSVKSAASRSSAKEIGTKDGGRDSDSNSNRNETPLEEVNITKNENDHDGEPVAKKPRVDSSPSDLPVAGPVTLSMCTESSQENGLTDGTENPDCQIDSSKDGNNHDGEPVSEKPREDAPPSDLPAAESVPMSNCTEPSLNSVQTERIENSDCLNEQRNDDNSTDEPNDRQGDERIQKNFNIMIEVIQTASAVSVGTLKKAKQRCEAGNVIPGKVHKMVQNVINLFDGVVQGLISINENELKPLIEK